MHPVHDAFGLWLTSVICELWFAFTWIFDQLPKWVPITRQTYLDRLSLRYFSIPGLKKPGSEVRLYDMIDHGYECAGMRGKMNRTCWQQWMYL